MIKTKGNGCKHVIFGHGTIGVWNEAKGNLVELYMSQIPMIPIGQREPFTGYERPEVILSFCNINSVDVLIGQLEDIKRKLEAN